MKIPELRKYFATLTLPQKREFIGNLQRKLANSKSVPYLQFLEECVQAYNAEQRERNAEIGAKRKMPEITPDSFAMALTTLIRGPRGETTAKARIIGTWRRDPDEGNFYYTFNANGTFETNEHDGEGVLRGNFTIGPGNTVLMEPHDKLKFTSLLFSQTADSLIITLKDGLAFEYKKAKS